MKKWRFWERYGEFHAGIIIIFANTAKAQRECENCVSNGNLLPPGERRPHPFSLKRVERCLFRVERGHEVQNGLRDFF